MMYHNPAKSDVHLKSSKKIIADVLDFLNHEHWDLKSKLKKNIVVQEFGVHIINLAYTVSEYLAYLNRSKAV